MCEFEHDRRREFQRSLVREIERAHDNLAQVAVKGATLTESSTDRGAGAERALFGDKSDSGDEDLFSAGKGVAEQSRAPAETKVRGWVCADGPRSAGEGAILHRIREGLRWIPEGRAVLHKKRKGKYSQDLTGSRSLLLVWKRKELKPTCAKFSVYRERNSDHVMRSDGDALKFSLRRRHRLKRSRENHPAPSPCSEASISPPPSRNAPAAPSLQTRRRRHRRRRRQVQISVLKVSFQGQSGAEKCEAVRFG